MTTGSATADGPRDAMCLSKSCQLLHNSVGTTFMTNPVQIAVLESQGYSRSTCNKLVHSATTRSIVGDFVDHINKPTTCIGKIL